MIWHVTYVIDLLDVYCPINDKLLLCIVMSDHSPCTLTQPLSGPVASQISCDEVIAIHEVPVVPTGPQRGRLFKPKHQLLR